MRTSCHSLDRVEATFDDERLVANAGLIAPASVAQHLGLKEVIDERVDLGEAPGRANVGHKAMTVIHAVLAGAEFIDGCDVLRAGSTAAVLGHAVAAPSTIGTFLRSFSWGHARQVDAVAAEMLGRAWATGAGPDDLAGEFTIDVDSSIHETYGLQKQGGSRFGYTQVRGYHPLYAIAGEDGEVLHCRLRGGNCHTARGADGFLAETFSRVRAAGVTGPLKMRGDSGFYSKKVVAACQRAGANWSITVKLYPNIHAAISTIPDDAWKPIPYWLDDGADVAAIDFAAFKAHKTDPGVACRLVVRRTKPTPGSQLALLVDWSYHAFIADLDGDPVELDAWHRAHANCENAIRDLKYGVGLNHLPSGRFGANAAWLALNVL
ncbi:MAG TPA: IS1380 family transposase, partial [Novosphingobium sp.]|nr:IS1380 family transposase [Novosphingobium sp.]